MTKTSRRLKLSLVVGLLLSVAIGMGLSLAAAIQERGSESEYGFAEGLAINSLLAAVFVIPIFLILGGGLSARNRCQDSFYAEHSHPPEPAVGPVSNSESSPPAR
jgi:hypothetical protein